MMPLDMLRLGLLASETCFAFGEDSSEDGDATCFAFGEDSSEDGDATSAAGALVKSKVDEGIKFSRACTLPCTSPKVVQNKSSRSVVCGITFSNGLSPTS